MPLVFACYEQLQDSIFKAYNLFYVFMYGCIYSSFAIFYFFYSCIDGHPGYHYILAIVTYAVMIMSPDVFMKL